MIGRRDLLAGGGVLLLGSLIGGPARARSLPQQVLDAMRPALGDALTDSDAARDWSEALFVGNRSLVPLTADYLLFSFFVSTTAGAALEDGHAPVFLQLHDPLTPCSNGLGAAFAPGD